MQDGNDFGRGLEDGPSGGDQGAPYVAGGKHDFIVEGIQCEIQLQSILIPGSILKISLINISCIGFLIPSENAAPEIFRCN